MINEQIKIIDYLAQRDIYPTSNKQNIFWFLSPFRNEKTASFKVDNSKNCYYDFGEGKGGALVTLISRLENIPIGNIVYRYSKNNFSFQKLKKNTSTIFEEKNKIQIIESKPVYSYVLKLYLKERGILSTKAYQFLEEIKFRINDGSLQFALGFKNIDGKYEIRNSIFKGCNGKNITLLFNSADDKRVFIFEGFFDFLSFLEINNYPNLNYIILNSTANLSKLFKYLDSENYKEIHLYLDNDLSGENCTNEIISSYNSSVIDHRMEYKNYNDLNEFITANSILK